MAADKGPRFPELAFLHCAVLCYNLLTPNTLLDLPDLRLKHLSNCFLLRRPSV